MLKKITLTVISFIFILSASLNAADPLSEAKIREGKGWETKWRKKDAVNADLYLEEAVKYYKEYINNNEIRLADIETRKFTPFTAQKRVVYIYKFGLLNYAQAKIELQQLLKMYKSAAAKFKTAKIYIRTYTMISQLSDEFKHNGLILSVDGDNLLCLYRGAIPAGDLLVYEGIVPVAKAKIEDSKTVTGDNYLLSAQVLRKNKAVEIRPFFSAAVVKLREEADSKRLELAEKYYQSGKELFEKREFEDAQDSFWYALRYDPQKKEAMSLLGLTYFYYQDVDNAERLYLSALEVDPGYLEAYIDLAGLYLGSSEFPIDTNQAFDMLRGILSVNQSYIRPFYWYGHALDDFFLFEQAREYYKKGAQTLPVLTVDNWYKETSLKKKLSSAGQIYWDTANICLFDKEPMLNSSLYVFKEMLRLNPDDLAAKNRVEEILSACPCAGNTLAYRDVIEYRQRGLQLAAENKLEEAIDEIRISLYLDQVISSEFRRCTRKISRIKID